MTQETEPTPEGTSRGERKQSGEIIGDRAANVIIGVVTAIWAGNIVAGMFEINNYQPSESINGIFMTIVGGAFILRARARGGE